MDAKSNTPPDEKPPEAETSSPAAPDEDDVNALDMPDTTPAEGDAKPDTATTTSTSDRPKPADEKAAGGLKAFLQRFNLYLLIFILILVTAAGIIMITYLQSAKNSTATISSQSLTQNDLTQLANSDATVGEPKQILNIESNAVFAGQVLIRQGLEVGDNLQVSGSSTLSSLGVTGQSTFNQVQISKGLTVSGTVGIQGNETVSQDLQVSGNGTFGGDLTAPQVTTTALQINGDLTLQHHLVSAGPTPSHQTGAALGNGGTASLSGTDIDGLATINTGGSPAAGCFISVSFSTAYATSPHVLLTPVGSSAGGLAYYVTISNTGFSICDSTPPPSAASFGFDYFVIG